MIRDVRDSDQDVEQIIFADECSAPDGSGHYHAFSIVRPPRAGIPGVVLHDGGYDSSDLSEGAVLITSKVHAENLIKALQETINVGWLK